VFRSELGALNQIVVSSFKLTQTHQFWESLMDYDVSESASSDENIKRLVVDELYWDSRVDASKVTVEVTDGIVTLAGHVPTVADRYSAEADARLIRNVVTVENDIQVDQPEIVPDRELQDTVTRTLDWTPDVDTAGLEVSAKEGTVTLRGTVPSYWEKLRAHLLAARVPGVVHVIDEIAVTPAETYEDHLIANALERVLDRSLYDDVNAVQVTVKRGVVTLQGQVPDASVRRTIQESAERILGVTEIHNELKVSHE
jgi:osmotically-inducible protein OsmY